MADTPPDHQWSVEALLAANINAEDIGLIAEDLPQPGLDGVFLVLDEPPPERDWSVEQLLASTPANAGLIAEDLPEPGLGGVFVVLDSEEEGVRVLRLFE